MMLGSKIIVLLAFFVLVDTGLAVNYTEESDDDEYIQLRRKLLANYDRRMRPNYGGYPVRLTLILQPLQIIDMKWVDNRLAWEPVDTYQENPNLSSLMINLPADSIWSILPYVELVNQHVSGEEIYGPVSGYDTSNVTVTPDGKVELITQPLSSVIPCWKTALIDDAFTCNITLSNWRYRAPDLYFRVPSSAPAIDVSEFKNDEWDITDFSAKRGIRVTPIGIVSTVDFEITVGKVDVSTTAFPKFTPSSAQPTKAGFFQIFFVFTILNIIKF
ncbi:gamma-aminobutyric acid receptor subunit beta-1-like [Glandiceps talaboti]